MKEECFFKVGKSYIDKKRNQFKVTSVDNDIVVTDQKILFCGVFLDYISFIVGGEMYNDLVAINTNPNAKRLIFVFPGGYWVCCDALMEELGDYRTYAYIWKGRVEYKQEYKHLLTDEEIESIESFANGM
ncbi:hypothetical protein MUN53_14425 [Parabacteroides sp. AGMB00274]|uniref:Uncharacterized protein n=1 Tax=Parabacteroides faecalis TaxID=2924040 RepID=A0ABT0C4H8_9BACT|nr:hypothetical protein [Parabacteroides faecalis]MCJ2381785.1 hypothetical protein [Parabacteroides faecalis]